MDGRISFCLQGRENNFDFIRFVAALVVIFSHSFLLTNAIEDEPLMLFTSGHFDTAHLSVAAFFIISGFLITRSYARSQSLIGYFEARILRIYPALIFVIFCTVFIIGPLVTTYNLRNYFFNYETIKYLLLNVLIVKVQYTLPGVFHYRGGASTVNPSLWTLPVELACYCLVVVVGLLVQKRIKLSIILGIFTLTTFYYVFSNGFISLLLYFLIGSIIYIFRDRIILNKFAAIIALGLLFVNLYFNTNPNSSFIIKTTNIIVKGITLSYVLIYLAFVKTTYIKNFARNGDYSYGLYIWGFPLQQIIKIHYMNIGPYYLFTVSTIVVLVFSVLSWHLIEKRALRLKGRYTSKLNLI